MPKSKLHAMLAVTALLLLGFVATSVISYFAARDALGEQIAEEALPLTSDNIYSEIQRDLLRSTLISSLMAHDTFVRDWTLSGEQDPGRIIRYLSEIKKKYHATTAFFVSERTRRYYHPDGILKTVQRDDPGDAWYFRVREAQKPYEINVDHDTADRSRVTIFVNYRVTGYDGEYLGAIGIGLAVRRVAEMIETYQQRYGRQIFFVDREGHVTLRGSGFTGATRLQERPGLKPFATRVLANPSSSFSFENANGSTVFVNTRLVPDFDWYLVVQQTETGTDTRLLNVLIVNVLVAVGLAVLVLVLGRFAVRGYQRRLEEMATTDKLTGAANRHVFDMIFDHVIKDAGRRDDPVSLITIDIDRFKGLNDGYGHQGGDLVMKELVKLVRRHIRATDDICRWGGDEFVVLLGGCDVDDACALAEKLRKAIGEEPIPFGREEIFVTVSIGVAEYRDGEGLESLVKRADSALYDSKQAGRNRVTYA